MARPEEDQRLRLDEAHPRPEHDVPLEMQAPLDAKPAALDPEQSSEDTQSSRSPASDGAMGTSRIAFLGQERPRIEREPSSPGVSTPSPLPHTPTTALGPSTRTPLHRPSSPDQSPAINGTVPPTPILALGPAQEALPDQPEFAELLTPAQLRRRRRPRQLVAPSGLGALAGQPLLAGPSRLGWTTGDGELYRGATADPTAVALPAPDVDEDAATVTSGSSGSSSWSWGSGGLGGAARVVQRVFRRGSTSSGSDSSSMASSSSSSSDGAASRLRGFGRALTRTMSRATAESAPEERPRRVYVPRRREFTLVLPSEGAVGREEGTPGTPMEDLREYGAPTPASTPNRVITTPVLPPLLEAIRAARAKVGIAIPEPDQPVPVRRHHHGRQTADIPVRRGGSAPGKGRNAQRTFPAPPVPIRPMAARTLSRIDALKTSAGLTVRPKSASDLLGMAAPRSQSAVSLRAAAEDESIPTEPPSRASTLSDVPIDTTPPKPPPAWWLDVSCPTWKDLRDIGELLGLHPLTLEDVLHQDPREKLDTYDKLGYYFIVVRALDEQYFKYTPGASTDLPPGADLAEASGTAMHVHEAPVREKKESARRGWGFGRASGRAASKSGEKVEIVEDNPGKEGLEGVGVGGVNLYLVVFADGMVSFHFDDVSKHTLRVRNRMLSAHGQEPTADWIAHGLLDSIVDAFFPLTGYVDGAVDDMDSLTIDPSQDPRKITPQAGIEKEAPSDTPYADHIERDKDDVEWIEMEDTAVARRRRRTVGPAVKHLKKSAFSQALRKAITPSSLNAANADTNVKIVMLYLKLFFLPITKARPRPHETAVPDVYDRSTMLRSITNMRRLVTGLSRLLGGKHAVVASLLKRANDNARLGHASSDVEAYLSDVQDHILLLQTSLHHYEYILAQCQPAYLSYISVSSTLSRGGTDQLILALSTVSIGILPMQFVLGAFSMNIVVPTNHGPDGEVTYDDGTQRPLNYFAGIFVCIFLVACGVLSLVRWWRWRARRKWTLRRGGDLPAAWDGYWGFQ